METIRGSVNATTTTETSITSSTSMTSNESKTKENSFHNSENSSIRTTQFPPLGKHEMQRKEWNNNGSLSSFSDSLPSVAVSPKKAAATSSNNDDVNDDILAFYQAKEALLKMRAEKK
jgi:hypothetical protein